MVSEEFGYERLGIWQKGMQLVTETYLLTSMFPPDERFGLTAQLRRAAVSVPANIAEGYGLGSKVQLRRYLRMALGSVYEVRTELEIAARTGVAKREEMEKVVTLALDLSRMLGAFIKNTTT